MLVHNQPDICGVLVTFVDFRAYSAMARYDVVDRNNRTTWVIQTC